MVFIIEPGLVLQSGPGSRENCTCVHGRKLGFIFPLIYISFHDALYPCVCSVNTLSGITNISRCVDRRTKNIKATNKLL